MTVTSNRPSPLFAGTDVTLTCTVSLDFNADSVDSVEITWKGPRPVPGERYFVSPYSESRGTYNNTLTISPLAASQDDGMYVCTVRVTGGSNVRETTNSDTAVITVISKNCCNCYLCYEAFNKHTCYGKIIVVYN